MPDRVKRLFWDADRSKLDPARHERYVIARVLDYGDAADVAWLFAAYGADRVRVAVEQSRSLLPKTANYWRHHFGLGVPAGV